jgi:hypothetical protein
VAPSAQDGLDTGNRGRVDPARRGCGHCRGGFRQWSPKSGIPGRRSLGQPYSHRTRGQRGACSGRAFRGAESGSAGDQRGACSGRAFRGAESGSAGDQRGACSGRAFRGAESLGSGALYGKRDDGWCFVTRVAVSGEFMGLARDALPQSELEPDNVKDCTFVWE